MSTTPTNPAATPTATGDVSDEALMLQVVTGDQQAFRVLLTRWKQPLMNYFYRVLGHAETSEELTQEAFVKVWKTKKYQPQARFSTWLYRLAYHVLVDHWRKQGRQPLNMHQPIELAFELPSLVAGPEEQAMQSESREQIQSALQSLPRKQQEILVLSKFQDLKYDQIAEITGCPAKGVKVQVFRALKNLSQKLKESRHER